LIKQSFIPKIVIFSSPNQSACGKAGRPSHFAHAA
jgi:hypothetical protein